MNHRWVLQKWVFRSLILNLVVAIAYAVGVELSEKFATLPGSVASVWFPSGMTLALVYLLGNRVLVGIATGSILAISLDLLQIDSSISIFNFLLVNVGCALGNCLQPLIATHLIRKFTKHKNIFSHVDTVILYAVAAIFSPMVSATIGMTSLCLAGLVPWLNYGVGWLTWWIASAIAHLIFTPTILLCKKSQKAEHRLNLWEIGLMLVSFLIVSWTSFGHGYRVEYLLLPILIWTSGRCGTFFASLLVSVVSLIAIFASVHGYGFCNRSSPNESLLLLQSFMAVFALTSLILSAVIDERTEVQLLLIQSIEDLERQVIERTAKLQHSETSLKQANLELEKLINLDALTQVSNRRCFDDRIRFEWERLSREQQPMSLLLLDIDYFKRYNDCYGHQCGDKCLTMIAQALERTLHRPADLLARYGGEEFVAILPNTEINGAITVAEEIRMVVANLDILHQNSDISDRVTVSIGITSLIPSPTQKSSTLINQADIALYQAKQQGRNRAIVFSE